MSGDIETALSKIRPHTSSSLPHQKAPANLLVALEATFKEQSTERTPAAYFAGLLTTIESTVEDEQGGNYALGDADLLPAELYMLSLVCPFVPAPVVRANMNAIISVTSPLWTSLTSHPPPLRSQLTLYNALLRAADRSQLETQSLRQSFATILQFCLDPRPKVRKRAADLVRDVLSSPPSPLLQHPYADRVAEWSRKALADIETLGTGKQKAKKTAEDFISTAIHLLAFLRPVLPYFPPSSLSSIASSLLAFPRLENPYLSQSAYGVLLDLLSFENDPSMRQSNDTSPAALLQAIISQAPLKTDAALIPPWVALIGKAVLALNRAEPEVASAEIGRIWKMIFPYLEASEVPVRRETASTLGNLTQCISHLVIDEAVKGKNNVVDQIITQLMKALDALSYVRAMAELLAVVSSVMEALRYRPDGRGTPTAAEILIAPLIDKIGGMRIKRGFEYKEAADSVLRTAIGVMGPEALLTILPLNIMPEDRTAGREARAFLLPLLVHPHSSPLGHFIQYFVPLTERMFDLQQKADAEGRPAEAKVWSVLVAQIWNGLPGYCYRTPDLQESLTPQFAQMLSQLLYNQPDLRPPVLRALKVLVESNTKASGNDSDPLGEDEIAKNLAYMRSQAESWFAVLFNVFGSVGRDSQGMVGEVISAWAEISDEKEVAKTCRKIIDMFKSNLNKMASSSMGRGTSRTQAADEQRTVVANMQDILVLLVPYLSKKDAQAVFDLCLSQQVLTNADNGVQKRAYKLLARILQANKMDVSSTIEELFAKLDEVAEKTLAAAKKDRLTLIKLLLSQIPSNALHVIPSLIPEAVLGTKEPSEKARVAAFELIVALGYKMKEGGVVKRHKLNGMDEDDMVEAPANVQEYFTMMAAGLAGASPHMISATITAMSRLIFEFKDDLSPEMHTEIFLTFLEYVKSANREIVKSALGYTKLFIHTAPPELLRPHLDTLVPALLNWAHDHKNHFKTKVRHIFERLIRRVGYDAVYAAAANVSEDGAKVLTNIKKRKDRAKRKKAQAGDADGESADGNADAQGPVTTGDAFEDVLYGSESEIDDSDEEDQAGSRGVTKKGRKSGAPGARLRIDDEEPMDLLQDASTRVVNRKAARKAKDSGRDFKKDSDTGKLIINSDSDSAAGSEVDEDARLAGAAYQEALTSADGFTRDARGRVKFNKDTKKRRRDAMNVDENEDVEMADANASGTQGGKNKKQKRKAPTKVGQEFKAKRAGGDVKKGGMDPYAYLPLSQAAKGGKARGAQRVTVTGKW